MHLFNIIKATKNNIPEIQEIISETWEPSYRSILSLEQINFMFEEIYQTEALTRQMEEEQQFFILYENKIPAGFASLSAYENQIYKLNKLYVKPAYQGKGYGSLLIKHVEQEARNQGGETLILNVNRHNQARLKYEHAGYTILKEEDIPIGPYWMNDYIMQKSLVAGNNLG